MNCPLCQGGIVRVQNDIDNRWHCDREGCWLHSNLLPFDVAIAIARRDEDEPEQNNDLSGRR